MNPAIIRAIEAIAETDPAISRRQIQMAVDILNGRSLPSCADTTSKLERLLKDLPTSRPYFNKKEAAEYIRCSVRTVDSLRSEGCLPYCSVGKKIIIRKEDIDRFVGSRMKWNGK